MLDEFGVALEDDVEVRVVDSTADVRALVVGSAHAGTDGMSEDGLAALVAREVDDRKGFPAGRSLCAGS